MPSPSEVRPATVQDKNEIWRLLRLLCAENGMFQLSDKKVDYYISRMLNPKGIEQDDTGPRGFIGVIGPIGALEGCIMLTIGSMWYTEDFTLDEHLNFVDPEHRASNHAKALIDFAKICADRIGIRLVIGVLSTHRTAAKVRLYSQKLTAAGVFFIYPPQSDQCKNMEIKSNMIVVHGAPKRNRYRPHRQERMAMKARIEAS